MALTTRPRRWGPLALATVAALASVWFFAWLGNVAGAQGTIDHSDVEHHHGFSEPGDVADWPPRPTGATTDLAPADGVVAAPPAGARVLAEAAQPLPIFIPGLAEALGEDWVHISSSPGRTGKDDNRPPEDTYFSRDLNQTIMVWSHPWGPEIKTYPASDLQPVVSEAEATQATDLGRAWLLNQGYSGVADLEGFAIRALDDGELHPVRMVYITFATSWFDDPLFAAYVDMTNLVAVDGGEL